MIPIINGKCTCTKCGKEFKWHHIISQKCTMAGIPVAFDFPINSQGADVLEKIEDKKHLFSTTCLNCEEYVEFEETVEQEINVFKNR